MCVCVIEIGRGRQKENFCREGAVHLFKFNTAVSSSVVNTNILYLYNMTAIIIIPRDVRHPISPVTQAYNNLQNLLQEGTASTTKPSIPTGTIQCGKKTLNFTQTI